LKSATLFDSFRHAADGLVYVLHRHRHMRYHFMLGALVLLVSAVLRVTRMELVMLCVAISLVIMAELVNTAIETVVDLVSPEFHPLAKIAKDVGGAVVLVASITAALVVVGVFVTAKGLGEITTIQARPNPHPLQLLLVGLVTVLVSAIVAKLWTGHWDLTRGGVVSVHSALAFFCFITTVYVSTDPILWVLAFVLALLVAQSRVEAGIHSVREVLIGAVVALVLGTGIYLALTMRGAP
jgi:diacylglycerol kinase (ATP)